MRFCVAVILAFALFGHVFTARADMIETKERGVMNGKIISQDDKEVRFEDSAKNLFVVPKKDVLFLEAQTDSMAIGQTNNKKGHDWGLGLQHWKYKAQSLFENSKSFVLKSTKKIKGNISTPLDRSSADSRSDALASSMGDLSTNLKALNKQNQKHASVKSKSKNKKTGNFSSLD